MLKGHSGSNADFQPCQSKLENSVLLLTPVGQGECRRQGS